jgi:hypothetical protein
VKELALPSHTPNEITADTVPRSFTCLHLRNAGAASAPSGWSTTRLDRWLTVPDFLNLAEAGDHAGVTPNGVRRWVKAGLLPSYRRVGSSTIYVRLDELNAFLTPRPVTP